MKWKWEDLKKINPFWYIVISLVLIGALAAFGEKVTTDKIVILFFQIVFMGIGSYGTYLKGELSLQDASIARQEKFELHAKARYRHLNGLFWTFVRISEEIENSQKVSVSALDRSKMIGGVSGQLEMMQKDIALCMKTWRDFAPNELDELHRELVDEVRER